MNDVQSSKTSQTTQDIANDLLDDMHRQLLPVMYIPLPQILNGRSKKLEQQTKMFPPQPILFLESLK